MKNLIAFFLVNIFAVVAFACDQQAYYYNDNCQNFRYVERNNWSQNNSLPVNSTIPNYSPSNNSSNFSPTPTPTPERLELKEPTPERIDTPTTIKFRTQENENLVLEVPSNMKIQSVAYVNVKRSSGEIIVVPLINNTFPSVRGNVCTYKLNGTQYNQHHYETLVQRGYLQLYLASK